MKYIKAFFLFLACHSMTAEKMHADAVQGDKSLSFLWWADARRVQKQNLSKKNDNLIRQTEASPIVTTSVPDPLTSS